jgi:hypothetical protein
MVKAIAIVWKVRFKFHKSVNAAWATDLELNFLIIAVVIKRTQVS